MLDLVQSFVPVPSYLALVISFLIFLTPKFSSSWDNRKFYSLMFGFQKMMGWLEAETRWLIKTHWLSKCITQKRKWQLPKSPSNPRSSKVRWRRRQGLWTWPKGSNKALIKRMGWCRVEFKNPWWRNSKQALEWGNQVLLQLNVRHITLDQFGCAKWSVSFMNWAFLRCDEYEFQEFIYFFQETCCHSPLDLI